MVTLGIKDLETHLRANAVFFATGTLPEIVQAQIPASLDKGQKLMVVFLEVPK